MRGFLAALLVLLFIIFNTAPVLADPFSDVPSDHWAYDAVSELTEKGYMDGYVDNTFKGRKVVTRYELALTLAKMITRLDNIDQVGGKITDQDMGLFNKLSTEFQDELNSLGVRLQQTEDRVKELEKKANAKPKLDISGYYQVRQWWVQDPDTTYNDPTNYDEGTDDVDSNDKAGFSNLFHDIYLKFLGTPYDSVETYLELHTWIFSNQFNLPYYTDNRSDIGQDPVLFQIDNQKGVEVEKAHFKYNHPWANIRMYQNESITPLTDPMKLTTGKDWLYGPDSGIEVNGSIYDVSHFTSIYNTDTQDNPRFASDGEYRKEQDTFITRWSYVVPQKLMNNSELIVSATYLEYIRDYLELGHYNKIWGADLSYKNNNYGRLSVISEVISTEDGIDDEGLLKDIGHKMDVSYTLDEYSYTLNYYNYGKDMRVRTSDVEGWFVDYEKWREGTKYYNYGRELESSSSWDQALDEDHLFSAGENFVRFTGKYDYDNRGSERDFQAEVVVQLKDWEERKDSPHITDGFRGQKYSMELWADINKLLKSRFKIQLHKDAFANETGAGRTEIEFNGTWKSKFKAKTEFWMERDADKENLLGNSESNYGMEGEVSTDITPSIWTKLSANWESNRHGFDGTNVDPAALEDDDDKQDNTEKQATEYEFESHIDFSTDLSLNNRLVSRFERWSSYDKFDKDTYWIITELKKDFTPKLKGKTVYWWKKVVNNDSDQGTIFENLYSELIYDATDKTKLKVIWGDWVGSNKDDRPAWGMPEIETEKKLLFEATTDF